jgi:hypothetical protein
MILDISEFKCTEKDVNFLIDCVLPSKTSNCYESMWKYIQKFYEKKNLKFSPIILIVDFEKAIHDEILVVFSSTKIKMLGNYGFGKFKAWDFEIKT